MRDTIDLLFALQQLDDEIDDLRADEEAIPEKKDQLAGEIVQIEGRLKALKQEAVDLAKLRKDKELELDSTSQKKAKFQGQLFQVKSNREYEALQHEITGLDAQVSSFEDEILDILERGEKASQSIAEEEKTLKAAQERVKQEHAALDKEAERLREEIASRDAKRTALISGLDQALLTRYDRIREVKDGLAVAAIKNGACGGCFRRIPPQEMQILRRADRVMTCEGCGRIILWRGEEQ
jgi:predicted  nucleic acid-binding Zn-ribbon protein